MIFSPPMWELTEVKCLILYKNFIHLDIFTQKLYCKIQYKNTIQEKEDRKMQLDYFYRIPKVLITSPQYKKVSDSAKLLYGLMLDRMSLSMNNGWIDEQNRVYIIFTLKQVIECMCCGKDKALKLLAELDTEKGIGLIERIKRGLGKPAIIYVKSFLVQNNTDKTHSNIFETQENNAQNVEVDNDEVKRSEKPKSGSLKNRSLEVEKADSNNTDFSNTNFNNNQSINQDNNYNIYNIPTAEKWIDRYNQTISEIKKQIDYDYLINTAERDIVDEIVNIMADVMTIYRPKYKIEGELVDVEAVVSNFQKITADRLEICLIAYNRRTQKISNPKAYWITVLYNIPLTSQLTLQNMVNNDMYEAGG